MGHFFLKKYFIYITLLYFSFSANLHCIYYEFPYFTPHSINIAAPISHFKKTKNKALIAQVSYQTASISNGFDQVGHSRPLGQIIFNNTFELQDIYLLSKLGKMSLLTLPGGDAPPQQVVLGSGKCEQFVSCLADSKLHFFAKKEKTKLNLDLGYHYIFKSKPKLALGIGIHIPITQIKHELDFFIENGNFHENLPLTIVLGESNVHQFFSNFNIDFVDFFNRGVLLDKGLRYDEYEDRLGIGDIEPFIYIDYILNSCIQHALLGISIKTPSGNNVSKSISIWPISLGNNKSTDFKFFCSTYLKKFHRYCSPIIYLGLQVPLKTKKCVRAPIKKNSRKELLIIEPFKLHTVENFEEFDSKIPNFADHQVPLTVKKGYKLSLQIGNDFGKLLDSSIELNACYQLVNKFPPDFGSNKKIDTSSLKKQSQYLKQSLIWSSKVYSTKLLEITLGGKHTIKGRNVARTNRFTLKISGCF